MKNNVPVIIRDMVKLANVSRLARPRREGVRLLKKVYLYLPSGYFLLGDPDKKDAPNNKPILIKSTALSATKELMDMEPEKYATNIFKIKSI